MKNLTHLVYDRYEYPLDVTTKEWLGNDYYYRKLVKTVNEAERFNYHSDYWGSADEYQELNIDLMYELEPWVGERCYVEDGDEYLEGTLEGILIDTQYNSISHTCILFSDVTEEKDEKTAKQASEDDDDVEYLYELKYVLQGAGYSVETFREAGLLTGNLGLVIDDNQFAWLGSWDDDAW